MWKFGGGGVEIRRGTRAYASEELFRTQLQSVSLGDYNPENKKSEWKCFVARVSASLHLSAGFAQSCAGFGGFNASFARRSTNIKRDKLPSKRCRNFAVNNAHMYACMHVRFYTVAADMITRLFVWELSR